MKSNKPKLPFFLYLILAILILGALITFLTGASVSVKFLQDPGLLWQRLIWPLLRLTFFISLGLFVGQLIEAMGWTHRLSVMARPLMRWGHLSDQLGATFTTAFFSGTASLSMLMAFHKDRKIGRRELSFAVLLNTFPSFFLHLPTTLFILLPLVGKAGAIYLMLTFLAALLRLAFVLTITHFALPKSQVHKAIPPSDKKSWNGLLGSTATKFRGRLVRILLIVLPVYLIIAALSDMGFFLWLRKSLAQGITSTLIPLEALSIVVFSLVAEFTSGYAAAGALLKSGVLDVVQTVLALLLGNVIAAPVRALRHQLPYYMGIFTPGLGVFLMIISQAFRIGSLIAVGLAFFLAVNALGYLTIQF